MAYAKEGEVKAGTQLKADDGFTCIEKDAVLTVEEGPNGLFVPCSAGRHDLDGQLEDGTEYIGFTEVKP